MFTFIMVIKMVIIKMGMMVMVIILLLMMIKMGNPEISTPNLLGT